MPKYKPKKKRSLERESDDGVFQVEKVVAHRTKDEEIEYFLKWKGYSSSMNTWEPSGHMNCPGLVREYWKENEDQSPTKKIVTSPSFSEGTKPLPKSAEKGAAKTDSRMAESKSQSRSEDGCDLGYELEKIQGMGVADDGRLVFLVEWNGHDDWELISNKKMNVKFPQEVIKYYEANLMFRDD
eukprot:m.308701 g.308701  ORF g.308701 m.308701 type:complete len:183 (+) comp44537_c0_seq1:87-635(+)